MAEKKRTFEEQIVELENIIDEMESEDGSLEDALKNFEKGIRLTKSCHKLLQSAEQKVKMLSKEGNEFKESDFDQED